MTHAQLLQAYECELSILRALAALRDYSTAGDSAFHVQRERVYWCKNALVLYEAKHRL